VLNGNRDDRGPTNFVEILRILFYFSFITVCMQWLKIETNLTSTFNTFKNWEFIHNLNVKIEYKPR